MAAVLPSNMLAAATPAILSPALLQVMNNQKDSRWLTLEVCREFVRGNCIRSADECKYAHPPEGVEIQNGRVTCCFDSIKGKCQRTDPPCKYLHPPAHLKEKLVENGRNNLMQKAQLQAQLSNYILTQMNQYPVQPVIFDQTIMPFVMDPSAMVSQPSYSMSQASAALQTANNGGLQTVSAIQAQPQQAQNPATNSGGLELTTWPPTPLLNHGLVQTQTVQPQQAQQVPQQTHMIVPHHNFTMAPTAIAGHQIPLQPQPNRMNRPDRVDICPVYMYTQQCPYAQQQCLYAHPAKEIKIDLMTGQAIVCMDFMNEKCERTNCKFLHPPEHLRRFIKEQTAPRRRSNPLPPPSSNVSVASSGTGASPVGAMACNGQLQQVVRPTATSGGTGTTGGHTAGSGDAFIASGPINN